MLAIYFRIAAKSFQRNLAYRAANLAGIATNTFFGAVYIAVYTTLLAGRGQVGGLDMRDAITYAVISQSLLMVMSAFGNKELSEAIIRGQISADLSRPVDFYFYWMALDLGRAAYYLLFRGLPTFVLGLALFRGRLPSSPATTALFLGCVGSGVLVSFTFRFITNALAFWTTDARGLNYLANTVILFFAGFIVPLNFFPPWLQTVAAALPFRALAHVPANVYLGKLSGAEIAATLALELAWAAGLMLVGRWTLGRMVRRLTVAGG